MLRVLCISCVLFAGCTSYVVSTGPVITREFIELSLENCLPEEKGFKSIVIELPKGYKSQKYNHHGFCEHRFEYRDSSFFYFSTEIYSGSPVNSMNRANIGISTYAVNRSLEPIDTIKNSGRQLDGNYWLEYVMGSYVIGYANVDSIYLSDFKNAVLSVRQIK